MKDERGVTRLRPQCASPGGIVMKVHRLVVAATAVVALGSALLAQSSAVATIKGRGKLVAVCFPQQDNPFISVNLAAGPMHRVGTPDHFNGIDVEVLSAFARSLGVTLEIRTVSTPSFGELIPALLRGDGDVIMGGFTITPERSKAVDFSTPYYSVLRMVITRNGSTMGSVNDFAGRSVALVSGSDALTGMQSMKIAKLRVRTLDFTRDCFLAVRDREADFTVVDSIYATVLLPDYPELQIAFSFGRPQQYGYGVPRGSDLKDALSAFLNDPANADLLSQVFQRHLPTPT